ncbi:MAG TPA: protease inhibitor I9 family protein [Pyrinomonadaceae bacterium]
MQRLKNNSILSLTIAILVLSSTTSSQTREPPATSRPDQQQGSSKPVSKFFKAKYPIANRYIVVLNDDVVSDSAPLEVRRAGVTAIANSHAQTYGGKVDYIYETALKGYAIELPNEEAAIAISNLPQVRWVEEDSLGAFPVAPPLTEPSPKSVCQRKPVAVSLLERPFELKVYGSRTSYLKAGISQRARLVIRDRAEFNELWNKIMSNRPDKPPLPEVDFSREMLIVAALGQQPSIYDIIIDSACELDKQLEVQVRITKFLPCGAYLGLLPETADMVRLPKTDLPVVFRETEVTSDCNGVLRSVGKQ